MAGPGRSPIEMDSLYPVKAGWIEKRGELNPSYKPRYFELVGHHLVYHKNEGGKAAGKINLGNITLITPIDNISSPNFRYTLHMLEPCKREWTLGFPSAVSLLGWLGPISRAMSNHCNHQFKILELNTMEEHARVQREEANQRRASRTSLDNRME